MRRGIKPMRLRTMHTQRGTGQLLPRTTPIQKEKILLHLGQILMRKGIIREQKSSILMLEVGQQLHMNPI